MPAKSQAQRGFIYSKFGPAFAKAHHFDNPGKLPEHVKPKGYQKGTANVMPPLPPSVGTLTIHKNRHAALAGQMPVLPQAVAHKKRNAGKMVMPPPSAPVQPIY